MRHGDVAEIEERTPARGRAPGPRSDSGTDAGPDPVAAFVGAHQRRVWTALRCFGADPQLAEELAQDALVAAVRAGVVGREPAVARRWLATTARRLWLARLIHEIPAAVTQVAGWCRHRAEPALDVSHEHACARNRLDSSPASDSRNLATGSRESAGLDDRRARARRREIGLEPDLVETAAVGTELDRLLGDDDGAARRAALAACVAALDARSRHALELRYRDGTSRAEMATALGIGEAGVEQLLRRLRAALAKCVERRLR
ncbi:MAG: sigma-70 family RNA polymerase sigma factor [Planctomycetes bacterium]|nr:sigma-70 family RNA polymerase sigma factor [Planctomycetota bacterium]